MIFLYFLLIAAGALPLVAFLVRRKNYVFILANGTKTTARVTEVRTIHFQRGPAYDVVYFAYLPAGSGTYETGQHKFKTGTYKRNDWIDIFYLPGRPGKYAIPGSKGELPMLIFMVSIFLFVIYACYKIHEMVGDSKITFHL